MSFNGYYCGSVLNKLSVLCTLGYKQQDCYSTFNTDEWLNNLLLVLFFFSMTGLQNPCLVTFLFFLYPSDRKIRYQLVTATVGYTVTFSTLFIFYFITNEFKIT